MAIIGRHNPKLCNVIVKDGTQYITMPNGDILPAQIFTRVTDKVNDQPYVIMKMFVNILDSQPLPTERPFVKPTIGQYIDWMYNQYTREELINSLSKHYGISKSEADKAITDHTT